MSAIPRKTELRRRRTRKRKLKRLRQHYYRAKNKEEKEKIFKKIIKIAPWLSKTQFLFNQPVKKGIRDK